MNGCQQYNLLCRIHPFDLVNCDIDTAAIRRLVHTHISALTVGHLLWLSVAVHHLFVLFLIPLSNFYAVVVVVSANKYQYGVDIVAVLSL